ncbi:MAG: hydroxyacid dehydrogenase [Saprospiraceae bacterium]|nr:hydroxyacid dehydrogenase [Saprospiraceae bacterium]MCB9310368.1 hypothetical protein [Lewinellaceae bacterium]
MAGFRVLITDRVHPLLIEGLEKNGVLVSYDTSIDNASLESCIQEFDGLIINSKIRMDAQKMEKGKKLKFIGRLGSGLEIIDLDAAKYFNIQVFNSPEGNENAVAEHALGMLLSLSNNLCKSNLEVRNFQWNREENRGFELEGKTLGIIGLGHTGGAFARKMSSWRLNVIAYDKYKEHFAEDLRFVEKVDLVTLQQRADFISVHLPLTEETKYFIDRLFINQCKQGFILINTSRGKIVNTLDLISALEQKKVGGACLDVFENEKPMEYTEAEINMYKSLFSHEKVLVSPHIAGWTRESLVKIAKVLLDKILNSGIIQNIQ